MAAVEPLEPESNNECRGFHLRRDQRVAGYVKTCAFTMKATVSFDAGDEVIMSIAGRVSRTCFRATPTYGWRRNGALDEIDARQRAADEKRTEDAQRRQQDAAVSQSALIQ